MKDHPVEMIWYRGCARQAPLKRTIGARAARCAPGPKADRASSVGVTSIAMRWSVHARGSLPMSAAGLAIGAASDPAETVRDRLRMG